MHRPVILLVDDNQLFLKLEKEFLREVDADIITAGDGIEALEVMKTVRPDLVLLDLHMPLMDGADCCAAMKKDPNLRTIPVVIVSNLDSVDDCERCRQAGCDAVLAKPVVKKEIVDCCRKFVSRQNPASRRADCRTQVVFRTADRFDYAMGEDIGMAGMVIVYRGELKTGERVHLTFVLPGLPEELIEASGRIAGRARNDRNGAAPAPAEGYEVEFVQLDDRVRRLIGAYLAKS